MKFCCQQLQQFSQDDETAIFYSPKFREFGISVLDGGSSSITIAYCPWCGTRLPESLRDEWFNRLEQRGLEPEDDRVPEEMRSDAWWNPDHQSNPALPPQNPAFLVRNDESATTTIVFRDPFNHNTVTCVVTHSPHAIGLTLSLESEGDIHVSMDKSIAQKLSTSLHQATA